MMVFFNGLGVSLKISTDGDPSITPLYSVLVASLLSESGTVDLVLVWVVACCLTPMSSRRALVVGECTAASANSESELEKDWNR